MPVERFDVLISVALVASGEIPLYATVDGPRFKRYLHELGAAIDGDGDAKSVREANVLQVRDNPAAS